jgi:hypothetical protein
VVNPKFVENNHSQAWQGVAPQTMKMQQQVLRTAQEDNLLLIARPIFRADPSTPFAAKYAANFAQDDSKIMMRTSD